MGCINFEHFFFCFSSFIVIVTEWKVSKWTFHTMCLTHFCSMFPFITPWFNQKILRFANDFREYWKKTLERNGLMLPCGSSMKYVRSPTLSFGAPSPSQSSCTLIYASATPPPSTSQRARSTYFFCQPLPPAQPNS